MSRTTTNRPTDQPHERTKQEQLPNRSLQEVIRHFYLWKQTDEYRSWKAERPLQYVEQAIPDYHADTCDVRSFLTSVDSPFGLDRKEGRIGRSGFREAYL